MKIVKYTLDKKLKRKENNKRHNITRSIANSMGISIKKRRKNKK